MKVVKLKDICNSMHQGINTVVDKIKYQDKGLPIIQSKHITQGYLDLSDARLVSLTDYEKYKEKYNPRVGNILICNIGTIGKTLYIDKNEKFLIAWNLFLIKIDESLAFPKYIRFYLDQLQNDNYFDKFLTGGTVKFINKTTMGDIEIYLPPLSTQKHIVSILEKAEKLKEKRQITNEDTNKIIQSVFYEMFGDPVKNEKGWQIKLVQEVTMSHDNKRIPVKASAREKTTGRYPYYGASGIIDYVDEYIFDYDTILIAEDGANLISRSTPIAFKATGKYWVNNHAHVLTTKEKLNEEFLIILLNQLDLKRYITGSAQPKLNAKALNNIGIILPSIQLQNRFADIVKRIESLKEKQNQSTSDINNLFDALMQKAFNGELVE